MQAADIVRIMGIGRNEYIATMVQVGLAFGVPFFSKKKFPARGGLARDGLALWVEFCSL